MTPLTLPQARIPLGWVMVGGKRIPVEIDIEWMRAFLDLVGRTGGVAGIDFSALIAELAAAPLPQAHMTQTDPLMPANCQAPMADASPDARIQALEADLHKLQQQVDGLLQGYQV